MGYETRQLAKTFGVDPMTIRNWVAEYADHLSADAVPGKGKRRSFTEDDFMILALVAELRKHKDPAVIHEALRAGDRASIPLLAPNEIDEISIRRQLQSLQVELERERAMTVIAIQERDDAIREKDNIIKLYQPSTEEVTRLSAIVEERNARIVQLEARFDAILSDVRKLERETGEAYMKGRMDQMREDLAPPSTPKPDAPPSPG